MGASKVGGKELRILNAGMRRFARSGYAHVTMADIAAEANTSEAGLYHSFSTKENVLSAVLQREQERCLGKIEEVLRENVSAAQKLRKFVEERLRHSQTLSKFGTLSADPFITSRPPLRNLFHNFEEKERQLMEKIIEEGVAAGEFAPTLDRRTPQVLLSVLQGLRLRTVHASGANWEERGRRRQKTEVMFATELFIRGIGAP